MKMTYDVRGDVLYIILRKEVETDVDRTIQVNDYVLVDVDAQGRPLGIEVLNAQRLAGDESVTEVDVELLSLDAVRVLTERPDAVADS
jgi:uncharacterized protein YuzE